MVNGWKCEFCADFNVSKEVIEKHEVDCKFNPINKYCFTCEKYNQTWFGDDCEEDMDTISGEEDGKCIGWSPNDKQLYRKLKLVQLNKSN